MVYTTQGTCSRQITFDVVDNKLTNVRFLGGCSGIKAVQSPAEFLNQESFAASDNKDLEMSKAWSPISPGFFQFIFQRGIVIPA